MRAVHAVLCCACCVQVEAEPPLPPLRITVFIILFSLPVLFTLGTLPGWVAALWHRWQRRRQGEQLRQGDQQQQHQQQRGQPEDQPLPGQGEGSLLEEKGQEEEDGSTAGGGPGRIAGSCLSEGAGGSGSTGGDSSGRWELGGAAGAAVCAPEQPSSGPGAAAVAGLARVPTLRGLSRAYRRHPQLHRRCDAQPAGVAVVARCACCAPVA